MFDMANIAMSLGQYDYAQELYQQIINQGFTSREIYNNLGLCYVYQALALDVESTYFNLIIPFKMDLSTRLESQASTRDVFFPSELTMLLYDAKREFETAIRLDKNYFIARENLFFTDIALNYLGEHVSSKITLKDLIENNHTCEFCVKGHFAVVDKKINKANRLFKKGSSECAICEINTDFRKKQISKTKNYKKIRFDVFQEINGVDMYCKDFTSKDHDIYEKSMSFILGVKDFSNLRLIQLKKKIKGSTSCISIQEISTKEDKLKNSVDIYVDDDVDKILDNYKEVRIIHSANKKYISIVGQQLSFLIKDEKVSKWYSFVRIN